MEEEKKSFFAQWMEKPWIRAVAILLSVSLVFSIAGHGIYLIRENRAYEQEQARRLALEEEAKSRQQEFDSAYAAALSAIEEEDYPQAVEKLGICLDFLGDGSSRKYELLTTRASLHVLLGNYQEAVSDLDQVLEHGSVEPDVLLLKAQTELSLENYAQAQKDLEAYVQQNPDQAQPMEALTRIYELTGQYQNAAACYQRLSGMYPEQGDISLNAARCLILSQQLPEAKTVLQDYFASGNSENPGLAHFLRALLALQELQFQEAIDHYVLAMESGYENQICLEQILACSFVLGNYQDVRTCHDHYMTLYPEGSTDSSYYQQLGISEMALGDGVKAQEYLTRSLELDPKNAGSSYYRGLCRMNAAQWQPAEEDFGKAIEGSMMLQDAYYNRGLCRIQLQDLEGADADLQKAAEGEDRDLQAAAQLLLPEIQAVLHAQKNNPVT